MIEQIKVTKVRKTGINDLIVCILFCVFVMSPVFCRFLVNRTQHFQLSSSICMPLDKEIKVLSHVGAIKNEMTKPNGIEEILYDSDKDSETDTKPFKTAQTWREKFLDIVPKTFAPP
ncbi:MAG: hypothetical protein LBK97_04175 [Prevotellaceae bacterium]|nr:hypothetical protein [Prevotellaceae bacterium]